MKAEEQVYAVGIKIEAFQLFFNPGSLIGGRLINSL
jgi:hypothetical protein